MKLARPARAALVATLLAACSLATLAAAEKTAPARGGTTVRQCPA